MIDTVEISHKLQATGIPQNQAEAIAQSMLEIPDWANLATKADLKADLAALKAELIYWFLGAFLLNAVVQIAASFMRH